MGETTSAPRTGKWDDAQTEKVVARYKELGMTPEAVEKIAKETGRTPRSVQGKLTSEGVYVVPEKKPAAKRDEGPTKSDILRAIASMGFDIDGFDPAAKPALRNLQELVKKAKEAGVNF